MHAHRHVGHGSRDVIRLRESAEKVAAKAVEQVEFAARAGLDHFGGGEPGLVRDGKAVSFRERIDVFVMGLPPGSAVE